MRQTRVWLTNEAATLAAFEAHLRNLPHRTAFDQAWAGQVAAMAQRQRAILFGVMALSFVPTSYLILFLWGRVTDIQPLGFKFEDRVATFEVSLLAMCLLGLYAAPVAIIAAQAQQPIDAWLKHMRGDAAMLYTYAYEPPLLRAPWFNHPADLEPTRGARWIRGLALVAFYPVTVAVLLTVFGTQLWAIKWAITQRLGGNCQLLDDAARVCDTHVPSLLVVAVCAVVTLLNVCAYVPYAIPQPFERRTTA